MNTEFQWMPEQASSLAADVDNLYAYLLIVTGVFSVLIAAAIVYFAIKYRQGSKADRRGGHENTVVLEVTWIVVPFILTMIMFFWGAKLFFAQVRPPADAIEMTGVGRQWMWKFQHPDGRSEINDLHVPLGKPIKIRLISEDVIHSMYVPAFRIKQDVLPGRYTTIWFQPTKVGEYHLFCAEYCGTEHSKMRGTVYVMEPTRYEEWLAGGSKTDAPAVAGLKLFEQLRCDSCHRRDGVAGRGPALDQLFGSTVRLQDGQTLVADEAYIRESILRPNAKIVPGFPTVTMPSFEGQIGEESVLQLTAYIKSLGEAGAKDQGPRSETPNASMPGAAASAGSVPSTPYSVPGATAANSTAPQSPTATSQSPIPSAPRPAPVPSPSSSPTPTSPGPVLPNPGRS